MTYQVGDWSNILGICEVLKDTQWYMCAAGQTTRGSSPTNHWGECDIEEWKNKGERKRDRHRQPVHRDPDMQSMPKAITVGRLSEPVPFALTLNFHTYSRCRVVLNFSTKTSAFLHLYFAFNYTWIISCFQVSFYTCECSVLVINWHQGTMRVKLK